MIDTAFITKFSSEIKKKFADVRQTTIVEHLLYFILKQNSLEQHISSVNPEFSLSDSLFTYISSVFPAELSLENVISVYEGLIDSNKKKTMASHSHRLLLLIIFANMPYKNRPQANALK